MKTAVSIPDRVFEACERLARRLGMSRSQLYATALTQFLEDRSEAGVTEALNAVYTEEGSGVDPVLFALQVASMSDDEW